MKEVMLSAEPSETVREEVAWNLPVGFALVREARVVAVGVSFPTAGAVVQWLGEHRSTVVWPDMTDAMVVHGHEGTELIWDDRAATPAQDAHTPREQPQTRSGGTESGEGGGGAREGVRWFVPTLVWRDGHPDHEYRIEVRKEGEEGGQRVFFGDDDERRMWTWECTDCHPSAFGDEPTRPEALAALLLHEKAKHPRDPYGFPSLASPLPEVADVLRAENDRLRAQVERVRALADRHEAEAPAAGNGTWIGRIAAVLVSDLRAALDGPNSKAAPDCSKGCGNGEAGLRHG